MAFFCTAGRGTELFVAEELTVRGMDTEARVTDGKVFFNCAESSFRKLFQMKTVERMFVQIDHFKTNELDFDGKSEFQNSLCQRIIVKSKLQAVLKVYRQVQRTRPNGSGEISTVSCTTRPPRDDDLLGTGEAPAEKKHKLSETSAECDHASFRVNCKVAGFWGGVFKSGGRRGRQMDYLASYLGYKLTNQLNWQTDLRNPEIEICVFVNDEVVTVGIPITRSPISKRDYIFRSGLRQTVAWIMAHLADIQVDDVVLDPMCGKGTILVEGAREDWRGQYLGMDIDTSQLSDAVQNRATSKTEAMLHLIMASVCDLPLRDGCVDKVVCDAPFGCKHSAGANLATFYPRLLRQIHRVLKLDGTAVIMTSSPLKKMFLHCIHTSMSEKGSSSQTGSDGVTDVQKCAVEATGPWGEETATRFTLPTEPLTSGGSDHASAGGSDSAVGETTSLQNTSTSDGAKKTEEKNESVETTSLQNTSTSDGAKKTEVKNESVETGCKQKTDSIKIALFASREHYVKLGDTDAVIFVLKKI